LQTIFTGPADTTITGPATLLTGGLGGSTAGDLFIEHGLPIIVNSTYAHPGTTNLARFGAVFDGLPDLCAGGCIGTNFGGWGGRYRFDTGGGFDWQSEYEGAAYHRFCPNRCYGSDHAPYGGDDACRGCGGGASVRLSVYIR
jgi:hypothetical protein